MKLSFAHTRFGCYICFIIQGLVNNYAPLLFATFSKEYSLNLDELAILVSFNFLMQMVVDAMGVLFTEKIGFRRGMIIAHLTSFLGIAGLAIFPEIMPPFAGLLLASAFMALGSGFIEVLATPIVESLPNEENAAAISLLHSFYCWGHIGIVLLSTLFFALAGTENWQILTLLWAILPLANGILFLFVPLVPARSGAHEKKSPFAAFRYAEFPLFMLLMFTTGAAEQAIAQWVSLFAETGLGVSKTVGDLLGPCLFGLLMAISRTFYGAMGGKINLSRFMTGCVIGIIAGYAVTIFVPNPVISLMGCGIVGLCIGIFWPGALGLADKRIPRGGPSMVALMALAGDIGCALGPGVVGAAAERMGGDLRGGILCAMVFPVAALIVMLLVQCRKKKDKT